MAKAIVKKGLLKSSQAQFDYGDNDRDIIRACEKAAETIQSRLKRTSEDILAIGRELIKVKERLDHGQWLPWLAFHFGWNKFSAERFMRSYLSFSQIPQIVEFAPSAMYLLSAPSCPPEARQEAIRMAKKGSYVTHDIAKKIISAHMPNSKNPPPIPKGKYDLIYADPPWRYDHQITPNRKIENQYPTMPVDDICALKVPSAADCVLFMWATAPKLQEALQVVGAWGFSYKTHAIWDKEMIGMGYWFRGQHELLLVAIKGHYSPPIVDDRVSSVLRFKRKKHSQKPQEVYSLIERMFPDAKRIELFARNVRQGWDSWGNE